MTRYATVCCDAEILKVELGESEGCYRCAECGREFGYWADLGTVDLEALRALSTPDPANTFEIFTEHP